MMIKKDYCGMTVGDYLNYKLGIYIPKNDETESRNSLESLIISAKRRLILVTGNFDSTFYDGDIGSAILKKMLNGLDLSILLKEKVPGCNEKSVNVFIYDNYPFFNSVFKDDIPGYNYERLMNKFHVYFSTTGLQPHFCIADNDVFWESGHKPGEPRSAHIKFNSEIFVKDYADMFNRITGSEKVYPIKLDDLISAYKSQHRKFQRKIA